VAEKRAAEAMGVEAVEALVAVKEMVFIEPAANELATDEGAIAEPVAVKPTAVEPTAVDPTAV